MARFQIMFTLFALIALQVTTVFGQSIRDCRDVHTSCHGWAMKGECYKNRGFMYVYCPDTCGVCKVRDHRCMDLNILCPGWAERNECKNNKPYMEKMCSRSCAFCLSANDHEIPHIHSNVVAGKWKEWDKKHPEINRI